MTIIINGISQYYTGLNLYDIDKKENGLDNGLGKNKEEKIEVISLKEKYPVKYLEKKVYENIYVAKTIEECPSYNRDFYITSYNDIIAKHFGFLIDIKV